MTESIDSKIDSPSDRMTYILYGVNILVFLSATLILSSALYEREAVVWGGIVAGAVGTLALGFGLGKEAAFGFGYLDTMQRSALSIVALLVLFAVSLRVVFTSWEFVFPSLAANVLTGASIAAAFVVVVWLIQNHQLQRNNT